MPAAAAGARALGSIDRKRKVSQLLVEFADLCHVVLRELRGSTQQRAAVGGRPKKIRS